MLEIIVKLLINSFHCRKKSVFHMSHRKTLPNILITRTIPAKELSTLLRVSSILAASLDLTSVLQSAIDCTVEVLELDTGAIYLLENDQLFLGATTPPLLPELQWLLLQPEALSDHPHIEQSFALKRPISITDAHTAPLSPAETAICKARNLKSVLHIPLLHEEKSVGVLIVGTTGRIRELNAHEIDLCRTLSYQITLAVVNARLYQSLQKTNQELTRSYDATLEGWAKALEMRDQDTLGHTQRVVQLTEDLARKLSINESDLAHMRRGAMLHDIGKMAIPDSILRKKGPLSEEEWSVMHKHPEFAYKFLVNIDFLIPALDIPYCHHERWDGSGYPRGLKGMDIPLAARIFTIVDVYDAMTSNRPYRKALSHEDALQYIQEQSGKFFDPDIVNVFLNS